MLAYTLREIVSILTGGAGNIGKAGLAILEDLTTGSAGRDEVEDYQKVASWASGAKVSLRADCAVGGAGFTKSFRGLELSLKAEVGGCEGEAGQEKHKLPKIGVHFLESY